MTCWGCVSAEANKWGDDSPGDDGKSPCTSGCRRDVGFGGSGGGAGSRVIFHPLVSISLIDAQTDGIISWFFQSHPNVPGNMSRRSGAEGGSSSTFSKPSILLAELASWSSLVGFTGGFLLIPSDTPTSRPCTSKVCASYYLARVDISNVNKLTWINELVLVLTIQGTFMTYFFPSHGGGVGDIIYIVLYTMQSASSSNCHCIKPMHQYHHHYACVLGFRLEGHPYVNAILYNKADFRSFLEKTLRWLSLHSKTSLLTPTKLTPIP